MSTDGKLWDRGETLDELIERFTVGNDPQLDRELVAYDCWASAAHATMLCRIEVLTDDELAALLGELRAIEKEALAGRFEVDPRLEDGHTAIEVRLTEALGDVGRKIHTGRSRNDQVIAALRMYGREMLLRFVDEMLAACSVMLAMAEKHATTAIAGYSHTRQAMPSTVGHLLAAHVAGLLASMPWMLTAFGHLNRSPLGSASGFGTPLPIDRELTAELLAFDNVQVNTLAVQNDRGKTEALVMAALAAPLQDLARLATDVIWLSSDELRCFGLSGATTTGSSIMPQKRNPDVWELIRAAGARHRARVFEIGAVVGALPSGYHRDLQLTKEPFLRGMASAVDVMAVAQPALRGIDVDERRCAELLQTATAATDEVYRRVAGGEPFRSAYRDVAADPAGEVTIDAADSFRLRAHLGAPGALDLSPYGRAVTAHEQWVGGQRQRLTASRDALLG